jgi:hypothetical protein
VLQVELVTNYRWVQMNVVFLPQNQWCSHMSVFVQGVHIYLFRHILEFLVLGRNFMWMWFNIWWRKNINKKCISSFGSFHENFCSIKLMFGAPRPFCNYQVVFLLLQILHAYDEGFTL